MCKFKFDPNDRSFANHISFMYDEDLEGNSQEINEEWNFIPKPDCIPDQAIRIGTYVIRERGFYQEVERYRYLWVEKARWPNDMARSSWELFPRLSDREYQVLNSIPSKVLNKEWLLNLRSYLHWVELREIKRGVLKAFMKS